MGTRHLITIVKDGEFKLAQYGQWDGYPSGQGLEILEFFSEREGRADRLKSHVDQLHFVNEKEADALYQTVGIPAGQEWVNMDQSNAIKAALPSLHRDTGAGILWLLASGRCNPKEAVGFDEWLFGGPRIPTVNNLSFAGSFGCEWIYTIDLDNRALEVYQGRQDSEGEANRFTKLIKKQYAGEDGSPYFVRLAGKYDLDALPSWDQFLTEQQPDAVERVREWRESKAAEEQANSAVSDDATPAPDGAVDDDKPIWSM